MAKKKVKAKRGKRPNRKKAKKSKSILSKLFKAAILAAVLIALATGAFYVVIDRKVENYIRTGYTAENSQFLSAATKVFVSTNQAIELATLRSLLKTHNYHLVQRANLKPGEFSVSKSEVKIYRRSAELSDSTSLEAKVFKFRIAGGKVAANQGQLILEPVILSNLSSTTNSITEFATLESFPQLTVSAVLAAEDARFYDHFGLDLYGIMRAMMVNFRTGKFSQGGSSITQQLAKNTLLNRSKTLSRKFQEALAAISFEQRLTKGQILELYLNTTYLSQSGAYSINGFPAAAKYFFSKGISQLSVAESALLAGIIKAPSYYAPDRHPQRSKERRDLVLWMMLNNKYIDQQTYQKSLLEPVKLKQKKENYQKKAPYFINHLRKELGADFDLTKLKDQGLKIHTGLNPYLQNCAEAAVQDTLTDLKKTYPQIKKKTPAVALLAVESYSGLVKSWVGGVEYGSSQLDHVAQTSRQIGSTVKPFVYLTALDPALNNYKVATPITILTDQPIAVEQQNRLDWTPKNYDGNFRGAVTLRYALEKSLNIPAVYVTQKVTPSKVAKTIKSFGISRQLVAVPSIALGSTESSLLAMTAAYNTLANLGVRLDIRSYATITGDSGQMIKSSKINERRVADAAAVSVLNNILQGVVKRGTAARAKSLGVDFPVAGKTGTTNDARDSWFVGFSSGLTAGVWVGHDDNSPLRLTGSQAALPVWSRFMSCARSQIKTDELLLDPKVKTVEIDSESGLRYHPSCKGKPIKEIFVSGTEPPYYCDQGNRSYRDPVQSRPSSDEGRKSIIDLLLGD